MAAPSLSIVIPVYDEPVWIGDTIAAADAAVAASAFAGGAEIVVVDDGSAEPTKAALRALSPATPLRVIAQANQGRFAARRRGIEAASGEVVLLLDSRVTLGPGALAFLAEHW